jgi:protein-L-isoaspartate(D-aspartate) O-methyltransferase
MEPSKAREYMVEKHLEARGITDSRVIAVMGEMPREEFVPEAAKGIAYGDYPIPIGAGQTISQPYIVALMTELLELAPDDKVLEVGAGSGYQAAILAKLCRRVVAVEKIKDLADRAKKTLEKLKFSNIKIVHGDGSRGEIHYAPYDAIIVTSAAPKIPQPLIDQLREGGRIVIPIGDRINQELIKGVKIKGEIETSKHCDCRFVPLKGDYGWKF